MAKKVIRNTPPEKNNGVKKTKRKLSPSLELPSLAVPAIVWLGLLILCYAGARLDQTIFARNLDSWMMLVAGLSTVLFLVAAPIYRNARQLTKRFMKILVGGAGLFTLVICMAGIWSGVEFGRPITNSVVSAKEGEAQSKTFAAPGKHYRIFINGSFKDISEQEQAAADQEQKKKKKQQFKLTGNYSLQIRAADGRTVVSDYSGTFEQERTYRRVTKKGHDYVNVIKTSAFKELDLPQPGEYEIKIISLDQNLKPELRVEILPDRQYPVAVIILGAFVVLIMGFADFVIKPLRVDSYFGLATGMAFGFVGYFLLDAMPNGAFDMLGIDLLVGMVIGGGFAYIILLAAERVYARINRKYKLTLT